jgi:hypothetical protein
MDMLRSTLINRRIYRKDSIGLVKIDGRDHISGKEGESPGCVSIQTPT